MKLFFTLITLCVIFVTTEASPRFGLHATDSLKKDSLRSGDGRLRITPYPQIQQAQAIGFSYYPIANALIRKNHEGTSVFSAPGGQVPNFTTNPLINPMQGGWRLGSNPLIVIDGMPFSSNLPIYTTLNVFDYDEITVLSGLNSAPTFGVAGGSGTFVLNSKTGEGFEQPTFNANSYTTYSYIPEQTDVFGSTATQRQWTQSTSLAYQQDFGNADTRISLNHSGSHLNVPWVDKGTSNFYTATMNSGARILPNFLARIYLQYSKGKSVRDELETKTNFISTNLRLKFDITPWMNVSSTLAYQHNRIESNSPAGSANKDKNLLGNLFLNVDKKIGEHFTLAPFIGVQSSKQKFSAIANSGLSAYYQEYSNNVWLTGLNTNLNDVWFASFVYRSDDFTVLPSSTDQSTISGSTAIDVFKLAGISGTKLTFGKIRGAIGSSGVQMPQLYPFYEVQQPSFISVSGTKTSRELGADLAFFESRLGLSLTYFHDLQEDVLSLGFPQPMLFDLETRGFEVTLKATAVSQKDFSWFLSLLWGKAETDVLAPGEQNGGGGPALGSSYPDFKLGVLNQLVWKNWNLNLQIDGVRGGTYYRYTGGGFEVIDGSFIKLRDISLGYDLNRPGKRLSFATISIVGNNLWLISSKADKDPEELNSLGFYKSISLSVSLQF